MLNLKLLPVTVYVLFHIIFVGRYIDAIIEGHVEPGFSFVIDAASYFPENCAFGLLMNIGSFLLMLTVYVRYRQILEIIENHNMKTSANVEKNKKSAYFGVLSCLGIIIVGTFQTINLKYFHYFGILCCFGFGTLYLWSQANISYIIATLSCSKLMAQIRLAMAIICSILFLVALGTGLFSHFLYRGSYEEKWPSHDGGWLYQLVSTILEWIMAIIFNIFILSFTIEFQNTNIDHPVIRYGNVIEV